MLPVALRGHTESSTRVHYQGLPSRRHGMAVMSAAAKVLLVDDEPQVLVALEDVLGEEHTILTAQSADRALDVVRRHQDIAVILTDQRMPKMRGDELLAKLGVESPMQRILVTGYADISAVVGAINEGRIFAYVTKPWDNDDLRTKVSSAIDRYHLALELRQERQLLHDLMNNAIDGIAFRSSERRYQRVNRVYADLLGASSPSDLIGKTLEEVLPQSAAVETWQEQDRGVLDSGTPMVDDVRSYGTQEQRWVSETIAPITDPHGRSAGLLNIARDVTSRLSMEAALRDSERRYREQSALLNSILDSMDQGIVVADSRGKLVFFNRSAEHMLGSSAEGHTVSGWTAAFGLNEPGSALPLSSERDPLASAVRGVPISPTEVVLRVPGQEDRLLSLSATCLTDGANVSAGGVALLSDVTTQRRLEQQVLQSQKLDAVGQLAGGIAHDFANFLAIIQNYTYLIKDSLDENAPVQSDLTEVLDATQRATRLSRKLLTFSRPQLIEPKPTSINSLVRELERLLRPAMGGRIKLGIQLSEDVPLVKADEGQLEQVIMNLALNARDAIVDGGRLEIATHPIAPSDSNPRGGVKLVISDTGQGMTPETQRRVFEPFFTTKSLGRGTGLGLATVYGIVKQCGGKIELESQVGVGTTFTISLPAAEPATRDPTATSGKVAPRVERRILLVEDDTALRDATARLLRNQGYHVVVARDPAHAKQLCAAPECPVDLVLSDVMMPEMSGPALAKELVKAHPTLRVLFMSAYVGQSSIADDLLSSGIPIVEKPFEPSDLSEKLEQVFR